MRKFALLAGLLLCFGQAPAQRYTPVNGVHDERGLVTAITGVTLHITPDEVLHNTTLLIRDGKVAAAGTGIAIPPGAMVVDASGKHIYPAFIDCWSGYGVKLPEKQPYRANQFERNVPGAFAWNMALHPETRAADLFQVKPSEAAALRKQGFGTVFTHQADGIARGTGSIVALADEKENDVLLKADAGTCFSFEKGVSNQAYPSSQMGAIALLRQAWLDAGWYAAGGSRIRTDQSLEALQRNHDLPAFFEAHNWLEVLRADRVGDEFGTQYIVKTGGDGYQALDLLREAKTPLILPLNFPEAWDLSDVYTAPSVSLASMRHWEAAPANPALVYRAGIPFALTLSGLKKPEQSREAFRKAVEAGLPVKELLRALTQTPAKFLRAEDQLGDLRTGKIASFFISSDTLLHPQMQVLETWVQGKRYVHEQAVQPDIRGTYSLRVEGQPGMELQLSGNPFSPQASIKIGGKTIKPTFSQQSNRVNLLFTADDSLRSGRWILNGVYSQINGKPVLSGSGNIPPGQTVSWTAGFTAAVVDSAKKDSLPPRFTADSVKVWYPDMAYGFSERPRSETVWIKEATVWTCEAEGRLEQASVLIHNGKIVAVGKEIDPAKLLPKGTAYTTIDGKGFHVTPGIIDEHSHIAISNGVNEVGQSNTAEVRIGDVINPGDRAIYYALAGGVTTTQLLHGSANAIGGQAAMIKLLWGSGPEEMKVKNAPQHIKFALGENVKQSNWGHEYTVRFPQTRMGVEQVFYNDFQRAKEYRETWKAYNALPAKQRSNAVPPRRDLELDALVEILENKRYISCHSYVQSEINMLMHVADSMGFKVNTFTHILEGYKVADKMKAHGAAGSTFSDWWSYKMEVSEAIPYNGALMHGVGVTTGFNSDDPEMGRRLNQEAAKAVLYGGVPEEEALKFVTLNPARMLHIDGFTGSLKAGKDADVVVWTDHPLSVYAKTVCTFVDGIRYFDRDRDKALQEAAARERERITQKMLDEKAGGKPLRKPVHRPKHYYDCEDFHETDNTYEYE